VTEQADSWYWEQRWSNFRRGSKRITLDWGDGQASAVLYDEGVPRTTVALLEHLPLTVPVVHVAWSGEMLMSAQSYDMGVPEMENTVRLFRPGDLTWDPRFGELAFTYGTAEGRLPTGAHTVAVYGSIDSNLDGFARFARARPFEGVGELRLRPA